MALTLNAPETLADDHDAAGPIGVYEPDAMNNAATEEQTTEATTEATAAIDDEADDDNQHEGQAAGHEDAADGEATDEPTAHTDDDAFWRESELIGKIAQAEREAQQYEQCWQDAKDDAKEFKESHGLAVLRVRRFASELNDLIAGKTLPTKPSQSPELTTGVDGETTEAEPNENAWRAVTTLEVIEGIKGIGDKKRDALVDLAPTAGHLEDLRGEASRAHKSFKEVLPAGFGQKAANAIEDRLIGIVAKSALSAEQQVAAEKARQAASGEVPSKLETMLADVRDDAASCIQMSKRDDFLPEDEDEESAFMDGWVAGRAGKQADECPIDFIEAGDNNWLVGWVYAEVYRNWEDEPASDVAVAVASEPEAEPDAEPVAEAHHADDGDYVDVDDI